MAVLKPRLVSSRHFTFVRGEGVCDISDFGPGFDFGRVYDDACDEGITVHSERTGIDVVYAVHRTVRDNDNDIQYWEMISVSPGHTGHRLKIFND